MARVRVGTSGWSYPEWTGRFYPEGTSPADMLRIYASQFATVEVHSTYRRLPTSPALAGWIEAATAGFRFAPKAHMGITHRRDLDGVEERVGAFLAAVAPLGSALGPVFLSLPHQQPDLERLDRILAGLGQTSAAFELGPAWHRADVLDRLDAAGATLAVSDTVERPASAVPTVGPVAYLRLRRGDYRAPELDVWAERLAKVTADDRDAYVFLKHDDEASGPRLARELVRRLHG